MEIKMDTRTDEGRKKKGHKARKKERRISRKARERKNEE